MNSPIFDRNLILRKFDGKEFTSDYFTNNLDRFIGHLSSRRGKIKRVLEIGSLEGRSAIFFLEFFPGCELVSVDINSPEIEARLFSNLKEYESRTRLIRKRSTIALDELRDEKFDLIYIDGWHSRQQVMIDALLTWPMLNVGGVMIFDDYLWTSGNSTEDRPIQAVEAFVALHRQALYVLTANYQVFVEKHSDFTDWSFLSFLDLMPEPKSKS